MISGIVQSQLQQLNFRMLSSPPKETPCLFVYPHPDFQLQATVNIYTVSIDLPFLGVLHKCNHTTLASFT